MKDLFRYLVFFLILAGNISCDQDNLSVFWDFDHIPDRIWIGEQFWSVPLEDWQVKNGRIECNSAIQNATFSVLTYVMSENDKPFKVSVKMGLAGKGKNDGSSGLVIGAEAKEKK